MARTIPYDATRKALFRPAEDAEFFVGWSGEESEAALCAELSRLAYARERAAIERGLAAVGLALAAEPFDRDGTFGYLAAGDGLSVLAFRGTESDDPTDLIDDALFLPESWPGPGLVHHGFIRALDRVWRDVQPTVSARTGRVLFTEHSSGTALATLAAAIHPPSELFTFGSPRVGNARFAAEAGGRIEASRHVDCCDLVCRMPPKPYRYLGRLHYIDCGGEVHEELEPSFVCRD